MGDLDDLRVATVREHLRLENAHDLRGCIETFGSANYEVVPSGEHFDGPDQVHFFLSQNLVAFPDFVFAATRISPTTDAVLVEGRFQGTHLGAWRGLPATGKKVDFPMCLIFEFDGESMIKEKLYFDMTTALDQLDVADNYNSMRGKLTLVLTHPTVIARAYLFSLTRRRKTPGSD